MKQKQKILLARILLTASLFAVLFFLDGGICVALASVAYFLIGYDVLWKAIRGILRGRILDENFLMAVATIGAIALAVYTKSGDFSEAIAVMLFYQIGEWFQSIAVGKSRKSIQKLMKIRPDVALWETGEERVLVDPATVPVGSIVVVQTGERIPIDGVVIEGEAALDTSALTGESAPFDVAIGDEVLSGSVNMTGMLKIKTTKPFANSTVSRILSLVEEATSKKSKAEKFISKFARVYTPAVCLSALLLALLPPLLLICLSLSPLWGEWLYRALSFLVISCPCALVVSVPLAFFACIGGGSREGILIKGAGDIEKLAKTTAVLIDKTGTLTKGEFSVREIQAVGMEKEELLSLVAHAEYSSSHPIATSLKKAYKGVDYKLVSGVEAFGGKGVQATVSHRQVRVGKREWMEEQGVECLPSPKGGTTVHVAVDGIYRGFIHLIDEEKSTAKEGVEALKKLVSRVIMLSGDQTETAEFVAERLGIEEAQGNLLPADKLTALERVVNEGERTVFVGDGINDAPVLARADVGIAMGGVGSDASIETADVVIMDDEPKKIARAILRAKKCMRIVRQNVAFSLAVKFSCLLLGGFGIASLWLAIFADVGVMVLAVLNAMRALQRK